MSEIDDLTQAIWDDDIRSVRRLLEQRPGRALEANEHGVTGLMRATLCDYRSVRVVQALLDAGADAKARADGNDTLLHWIVDANSPGCWGKTPGRIAKLLADAGAPLEERQHWGWTPLLSAVMRGTIVELRALLDVGCDPNVFYPMHSMPEFTRGRSALCGTVADVEKIKLLLAHGADVHARDLNGQTALEVALQVLEESKASTEIYSEETLRLLQKTPDEWKADFQRKVMQSVRVLRKAAAST